MGKDNLLRENDKRLATCKIFIQELLELDEPPEANIAIALSLMLLNITIDEFSCGRENILFMDPKNNVGIQISTLQFIKDTYDDLIKRHSKGLNSTSLQ